MGRVRRDGEPRVGGEVEGVGGKRMDWPDLDLCARWVAGAAQKFARIFWRIGFGRFVGLAWIGIRSSTVSR